VQAFSTLAGGPRIVVGSSMGGWLALLLLRRLGSTDPDAAARIRGLVLIAPAADMAEVLMWRRFDVSARQKIEQEGRWLMPSAYGEGYVITRKLIEDGRKHLILDENLGVSYPVRILHGSDDLEVPWQLGLELFNRLAGEDVIFTLIKGGDHRLSSARDIQTILDTVNGVIRAKL